MDSPNQIKDGKKSSPSQQQQKPQQHDSGRSQVSIPSLPPPARGSDDMSLPPPPPLPGATGAGARAAYVGGKGVTGKEGDVKEELTEEDKEKLMAEEREKWKILPKTKGHGGSWVRRLFKEVGTDLSEDGDYSEKGAAPIAIVEGECYYYYYYYSCMCVIIIVIIITFLIILPFVLHACCI
jgi:hypothetical protein